ncbi:type IIL restriction-modification enzyme MmeI [Thiomonas sp. X19]|uniref:type IIL restriction-modification enzyme MmeI n=1 Tax=Thiomonas sp. X19 TaxID=1050370 RepID=UPI00352AB7CB
MFRSVFCWFFPSGQGKPRFHLSLALQAKPAPWSGCARHPVLSRVSARRFSHVFGVQAILDARALCPASTLADLYDPLTIPAEWRWWVALWANRSFLLYHRQYEKARCARYQRLGCCVTQPPWRIVRCTASDA